MNRILLSIPIVGTGMLLMSDSGCNHTAADFSLEKGQSITANIHRTPIYFSVTDIQDSRCPMNARCIRAGEAIVRFSVISNAHNENLSLCTGADCNRMQLDDTQIITLGNNKFELHLKNVTPDPTQTVIKGTKKAAFAIKYIKS